MKFGRDAKVHAGAVVKAKGGKIEIGHNTSIGPRAMLLAEGGEISIGNGCSVNPYTVLYGHGGLRIGNHVRIAAHTVIVPSNHIFSDTDRPIAHQGVTKQGVLIEDDVWIGANVTVLDGAHISKGCVIAAGAVVRGTTEPFSVYGGVPARKLKDRRAPATKPPQP